MDPLIKLHRVLHRMSLYIAGMLIFVMMILIVQDVIWRYVFNDPSDWVMDITRFLLCYVVFLGMAPALKDGSHVSVDLFLDWIGQKRLRWGLGLAAQIMVVLFACVFLWVLTSQTIQAFSDNRLSPTTVPIPLKWIYIIGPIGMILFLFTAVIQLAMHLTKWGDNDDQQI